LLDLGERTYLRLSLLPLQDKSARQQGGKHKGIQRWLVSCSRHPDMCILLLSRAFDLSNQIFIFQSS